LDTATKLYARNRTFEVARMLFGWCVKRGLLDASPCVGIEKLHEPRRTRVLSDAEVRQILGAFDETRFGRYVRLLFLTGARRDEVRSMRWQDIDTERGVGTLAPELEKTGSNRVEVRKVALSGAALAVLAEQREANLERGLGRALYVFPGPESGRLDRHAPKVT